jgi:hypothetical protein
VTKFYVYFQEKKESKKPNEVNFTKVRYFSTNPLILAADRTVGNCLEQMVPFLVSLWLHAIFISTETATQYGIAYVGARAFYPLFFRMGIPWLFVSTFPNYGCIALLLAPVTRAAFQKL